MSLKLYQHAIEVHKTFFVTWHIFFEFCRRSREKWNVTPLAQDLYRWESPTKRRCHFQSNDKGADIVAQRYLWVDWRNIDYHRWTERNDYAWPFRMFHEQMKMFHIVHLEKMKEMQMCWRRRNGSCTPHRSLRNPGVLSQSYGWDFLPFK